MEKLQLFQCCIILLLDLVPLDIIENGLIKYFTEKAKGGWGTDKWRLFCCKFKRLWIISDGDATIWEQDPLNNFSY